MCTKKPGATGLEEIELKNLFFTFFRELGGRFYIHHRRNRYTVFLNDICCLGALFRSATSDFFCAGVSTMRLRVVFFADLVMAFFALCLLPSGKQFLRSNVDTLLIDRLRSF